MFGVLTRAETGVATVLGEAGTVLALRHGSQVVAAAVGAGVGWRRGRVDKVVEVLVDGVLARHCEDGM